MSNDSIFQGREHMASPSSTAASNNIQQGQSTSMQQTEGHILSSKDNEIRWFLVRWMCTLMFLFLGVFLLTRDDNVIAASVVLGVAITLVFTYYFSQKKE